MENGVLLVQHNAMLVVPGGLRTPRQLNLRRRRAREARDSSNFPATYSVRKVKWSTALIEAIYISWSERLIMHQRA